MMFRAFIGFFKRDNTLASHFSLAFKEAVEDVSKEMANRFSANSHKQKLDRRKNSNKK